MSKPALDGVRVSPQGIYSNARAKCGVAARSRGLQLKFFSRLQLRNGAPWGAPEPQARAKALRLFSYFG